MPSFECSLTVEIMDCETPEQAAALAQATIDEATQGWVWECVNRETGERTMVDAEEVRGDA